MQTKVVGKIANKIANQIQNYQISGEISDKKLQNCGRQNYEIKLPNFRSIQQIYKMTPDPTQTLVGCSCKVLQAV